MNNLNQKTLNDPEQNLKLKEQLLSIIKPLIQDEWTLLNIDYHVNGFQSLNGLINKTSDFSSYLAGFNSWGLDRILPEASCATKL